MTFTRTDSLSSRVLVVERDPLMLTAMASVLNMQGHKAVMARSEDVALESLRQSSVDALILSIEDLHSGCRFATRLRSTDSTRDLPIIFLTPQQTAEWAAQLGQHGGVFSMLKPVDPYELIELVEKVLWMPHVAKGRLGGPNVAYTSQRDWVSLDD